MEKTFNINDVKIRFYGEKSKRKHNIKMSAKVKGEDYEFTVTKIKQHEESLFFDHLDKKMAIDLFNLQMRQSNIDFKIKHSYISKDSF